jgi:hypothetical protein
MSSPSEREVERLLQLLQAYDREELWLRVRQYYRLADQLDQVCVDVVDEAGQTLVDRAGRTCLHTLQVVSPMPSVDPGQVVALSRDGASVRIDFLPHGPEVRGSGVFYRYRSAFSYPN